MSIDTSKVASTNATTPAKASKPNPVGAAAGYLDDRTGLATAMKKQVRKVFPDHWSFMLGEIALWSFVIVLLTGVFLTLWFTPSMGETTKLVTKKLKWASPPSVAGPTPVSPSAVCASGGALSLASLVTAPLSPASAAPLSARPPLPPPLPALPLPPPAARAASVPLPGGHAPPGALVELQPAPAAIRAAPSIPSAEDRFIRALLLLALQIDLTGHAGGAVLVCRARVQTLDLDRALDVGDHPQGGPAQPGGGAAACNTRDDDGWITGDAQLQQGGDLRSRNGEAAGVGDVALDLALAAAVMAEVHRDLDAAQAGLSGRFPGERKRLAGDRAGPSP